jgi:hypothetical protein
MYYRWKGGVATYGLQPTNLEIGQVRVRFAQRALYRDSARLASADTEDKQKITDGEKRYKMISKKQNKVQSHKVYI